MAWNDHPPKKEELAGAKSWTSAPPSESELKFGVSPDDPTQSKVTALAAGIANPFGLADEMGAVGSTAMNAITGFSGPLAGGSMEDLANEYRYKRDATRAELQKIQAANPKTYMAGRLVSGVLTGGIVGGAPTTVGRAMLQGAGLGSVGGLGESEADLTRGEFKKAGWDTLKGAGIGAAAGVVGYGAGKLIQSVANGDLSRGLKSLAEKNAVKATGATGKQMSTFDDNAGRELLDRGLVKFGDTPGKIADRAQAALDEAHGHMDQVLKTLDDKGVKVSAEKVVSGLESKIAALKEDASQADVVRKLYGIIEDIKNTGNMKPIISFAEQTKRGFNRMAKNWQDPEKGQAGKEAYLAYRDEVENAAKAADPTLADLFINSKKTHGLLDPIEEAASRRAATLQQSPLGGLLDTTAAVGGLVKAGPVGAVIAPVARRVLSPRLAASVAVSADGLAKALAKTPEAFGKYAAVLQDAAIKGSRALSETNLFLKKDPGYVSMINGIASNGGLSDSVSKPDVAAIGQNTQDRSPSEDIKGEAKWAQYGLDKLGLQNDPSALDLLNSKQGKKLLIEAASLSKGSKRLQSIKNQIKRQGR